MAGDEREGGEGWRVLFPGFLAMGSLELATSFDRRCQLLSRSPFHTVLPESPFH